LADVRGDGEQGERVLGEALEAATAIPDARLSGIMAGWVSINLAVVARSTGNGALAERHIEDALGRFRAEQSHVGTMMALGDLGDLARDRGDWPRALSLYHDALAAGRTDQAKRIVIEVIESVASVAAHSGQLERSATLLGAAEGLRDRIGLRYRPSRNRLSLEETTDAARRGLPAETFSATWAAGRNLSVSQAIAAVLDLHDTTARSLTFALSPRESEVLQLLATGMTDPEIADALFISVRTVEHHVANLCRKLGVRTRTAATSTAIAAGLVAAGGPA
jgi:DNA-binding CsgD family transcriptional regulator